VRLRRVGAGTSAQLRRARARRSAASVPPMIPHPPKHASPGRSRPRRRLDRPLQDRTGRAPEDPGVQTIHNGTPTGADTPKHITRTLPLRDDARLPHSLARRERGSDARSSRSHSRRPRSGDHSYSCARARMGADAIDGHHEDASASRRRRGHPTAALRAANKAAMEEHPGLRPEIPTLAARAARSECPNAFSGSVVSSGTRLQVSSGKCQARNNRCLARSEQGSAPGSYRSASGGHARRRSAAYDLASHRVDTSAPGSDLRWHQPLTQRLAPRQAPPTGNDASVRLPDGAVDRPPSFEDRNDTGRRQPRTRVTNQPPR
jgi:hypothetical protein